MELTDKVLDRLNKQLKIFSGKDTRPVLKSMHYTDLGDVEFTNSHVAVRLKKCHESEEKTVPEVDTFYPSLSRIFDGLNQGSSIKLNTKDMTNILSPFSKEKQPVIIINFTKQGILFKSQEPEEFVVVSAKLDVELDMDEPFYVAANPKYLYDCFNFFRLLKIDTVQMTYSSAVKPMLFTFENLEYLVTPVRAGNDLKIKSKELKE